MDYRKAVQAARHEPGQLEALYQQAVRAQEADSFQASLLESYAEFPENLLYQAWFYRLRAPSPEMLAAPKVEGRFAANWILAIPLSLLTGLVFALLVVDENWLLGRNAPALAVIGGPIAALLLIVFLTLSGERGWRRPALAGLVLVAAVAYVLLVAPHNEHYINLMVLHLLLLSWAAVGFTVLGLRFSSQEFFAFLVKSIEVAVTGGVYLIAGVVFTMIGLAMFQALDIKIPDLLMRMVVAGGAGLIPILAVASVYDPRLQPAAQSFERGMGRLIAVLPRFLISLTLFILVVYLLVIPFNFMAPFRQREVLIVYNIFLFGAMALLAAAAPLDAGDLSPRYQRLLRQGILAVAVLVLVISLYALAAILYRTIHDGVTINRLAVIGWNLINMGILGILIYNQVKSGLPGWVQALHDSFRRGSYAYATWTLFLIAAIPWLF